MLAKSSLILLALAFVACAQPQFPKFADYPVTEIFKGTSAKPILTTPHQRLYRTRIRDAAAKGANFAGHYAIAEWGCGTGCSGTAMVDVQTGKTFDLPFPLVTYPMDTHFADDPQSNGGLTYTLASRLIILPGCPSGKDCATYYMEWTGTEFKLIRKLPTIAQK